MTVNTRKLSDEEIKRQYKIISDYHERFLKDKNVVLPGLYKGQQFSINALTLVFLSIGYPNTQTVSKQELTTFIRHYYPRVNDVQQARHLGAQSGFYIISGGRNDKGNIPRGSYKLVSLEETYPDFMKERRQTTSLDWMKIKQKYGFRCATCGSKEGEPNLHWSNVVTKLQKGHMDPRKELTDDNTIPQCEQCNRGDRNRWVYDNKGRVIKIANPHVILVCDDDVQYEVYKILYEKYNGKKPL